MKESEREGEREREREKQTLHNERLNDIYKNKVYES